jgi:hypothetical protein
VLLWSLAASSLSAQAVPRTDTPRAGAIRVTFDPTIEFWDQEFHNSTRRPLGSLLTGPALGAQVPQLARLEQDIGVASGASGFAVNLGAARLSLRAERRVTPLLLEVGLTNRLAIGARVPLVRVMMRQTFVLDSAQSNLGRNPRTVPGSQAESSYAAFFSAFDRSVAQMQLSLASGAYGPPGSTTYDAAQAFVDSAAAVRQALYRAAYGASPTDAAPFLPTATSAPGVAITANLVRIQQEFATTWGVPGFTDAFVLPAQRAAAADVSALLAGAPPGFGAQPIRDTHGAVRYWLGDVELQARYQMIKGATFATTLGGLVRLPTGHQESPNDLFDIPAGDGQLDLEAELTQELVLGGRLWLNAAVRAGMQQAGERSRRVGPPDQLLLPLPAATRLAWDPGDYLSASVAPLYRFTAQFGAGLTMSYYTQTTDRYRYRSAQDSTAVAAALGAPMPAALLNAGTAVRHARFGAAVVFSARRAEGAFSVERVVSARGTSVPARTVVRIVLRVERPLF